MIKKVEDLKSLNELHLSKRTISYIERKGLSVEDVVLLGRQYKWNKEHGQNAKEYTWLEEVADALEKAGFIRHDITPRTFLVDALYATVYESVDHISSVPTCIESLKTNREYELFQNITDEQFNTVMESIDNTCTERGAEIIKLRFGLKDGRKWDLEEVAKRFEVTTMRIRQIEAKTLRMLKQKNRLQVVFDSPEGSEAVDKLIDELTELQQDPAFKKEAELRQKLLSLAQSPFSYSRRAERYLRESKLFFTGITELCLTLRTQCCLKRAGINTVADILNFPKEEWMRIRNIGWKGVAEVEERMHSVGIKDFKILS